MNVRDATLSDVRAIILIERSSDCAAHWSEAEYERMFAVDAVPRVVLVGGDHAKVSGFLIARTAGPEWELENIAVAENCRRSGVGLTLVKALIHRATGSGVHDIHLEVRESNHAARLLYQRAGFHEVGVRSAYYDHPLESAILYRWTRLSAAP